MEIDLVEILNNANTNKTIKTTTMIKALLLIPIICFFTQFRGDIRQNKTTAETPTTEITDCKYNGIPLHGKIKFVTSFPDIKVKFVESFPDLKVKFVNSFPDDCGEWQIVESFPDIKVQIVESFPDVKVKIVESFPGMP